MRLADLLPLLGVGLSAILFVAMAAALRRTSDWQQRLVDTHLPVYARLLDYAFWTVWNLGLAFSERGRRLLRARNAALAFVLFLLVVLTPVLALEVASTSALDQQTGAAGSGAIFWSCVVAAPRWAERLQRDGITVEPLPLLVSILIVSVLNALIGVLALSDVLEGPWVEAACTGAALVGLADLVSTLTGVAVAAMGTRVLSGATPDGPDPSRPRPA